MLTGGTESGAGTSKQRSKSVLDGRTAVLLASCALFIAACVLLLRWNDRDRPLPEAEAGQTVLVTAADVGALTPYEPSEGDPLDLNTATMEQLEMLPGIGETLAARILAWREEHGRYERTDQLLEISGIGKAKYEAIAPLITAGDDDLEGNDESTGSR